MQRFHWWTLLGLSGVGLAALVLGEVVQGQAEPKAGAPKVSAPFVLPQPQAVAPTNGGSPSLPEAPRFPDSLPDKAAAPLPAPNLGPIANPTSAIPKLPAPPSAHGLKNDGQIMPLSPTLPSINAQKSEEKGAPLSSLPLPPPVSKSAGSALSPAASSTATSLPGNISLDVQPGKQQPAVTIEWIGPSAIRINQPLACQLVVRNNSTTPVQNVIVRYRLGQGVTCKASEPAAATEGGEMVWNLGVIGPQQMRRIDVALVAQTRGVLNCPAVVTFTTVAAYQVQVREPQLAVKISAPEKVIVGEHVKLSVAISNPGDGAAESIKVKAVLPEGFEHPRGKIVEFEAGDLAPNEARTAEIVCLAKGSGMQQCVIFAAGEGNLASRDSTQVDILVPKLNVVMSGPKLRYLDRHAVYVVKVTNPGSAPADNVEVQEVVPSGFKFHQANHGGQYQETTRLVSWSLGELQPGQTKEVAVDLVPIEAGEHRLVAHAKAGRGLKSESDARTVVEGLPSLSIDVGHVDDPIEVGAETAYEIRVANQGTKTETNVEVVCILPEQLELKGAKCSATLRYRQEGRELIFEPLARLAPKADVIFRVLVKGIAPGDIRFRTRIRADGLKEPVLREESTRIYSDDVPIRPTTNSLPQSDPVTSSPAGTKSLPLPMSPAPKTSTPAPSPMSLPFPTPSSTTPAPSGSSGVPAVPLPTPPVGSER